MPFYRKPNISPPPYFTSLPALVEQMVKQALDEDINLSSGGSDITAELISDSKNVTANLIARESGILCGTSWFNECFRILNSEIAIDWSVSEASLFEKNDILCTIKGNARAILTAERSALNFLQTLSATASITHEYARKISHTHCKLLDTRKTIPGFRLAQKYAVYCGGGENHRIGLYDAYLIKENHIRACGGIAKAIQTANKNQPGKLIEVEVESLAELEQAIAAKADIVMLDNFSNAAKTEAVSINQGQVSLEASGDITLNTIAEVAETGVDFISVGAITKHILATDFSLLISS